jgi:hypothetical protein
MIRRFEITSLLLLLIFSAAAFFQWFFIVPAIFTLAIFSGLIYIQAYQPQNKEIQTIKDELNALKTRVAGLSIAAQQRR